MLLNVTEIPSESTPAGDGGRDGDGDICMKRMSGPVLSEQNDLGMDTSTEPETHPTVDTTVQPEKTSTMGRKEGVCLSDRTNQHLQVHQDVLDASMNLQLMLRSMYLTLYYLLYLLVITLPNLIWKQVHRMPARSNRSPSCSLDT